jgi:hypothetical protein
MYAFNLRFSTWALASVLLSLFSLILIYVSQHKALTAIGQKNSTSYFSVITKDTPRNRDREKS